MSNTIDFEKHAKKRRESIESFCSKYKVTEKDIDSNPWPVIFELIHVRNVYREALENLIEYQIGIINTPEVHSEIKLELLNLSGKLFSDALNSQKK